VAQGVGPEFKPQYHKKKSLAVSLPLKSSKCQFSDATISSTSVREQRGPSIAVETEEHIVWTQGQMLIEVEAK
jgi:hypothetical protein